MIISLNMLSSLLACMSKRPEQPCFAIDSFSITGVAALNFFSKHMLAHNIGQAANKATKKGAMRRIWQQFS